MYSIFKTILFCLVIIQSCIIKPSVSTSQQVINIPVFLHGWGDNPGVAKDIGMGGYLPPNSEDYLHFPDEFKHEKSFVGNLKKINWYTQPAVHAIATHLHMQVQEAKKQNPSAKLRFHVLGHSCGAGTFLNFLSKLHSYEEDSNYFKGTGINTKEDAKTILQAIDNGTIQLSAPLLSVKKVNFLLNISPTVGIIAFLGAFCMASRMNLFTKMFEAGGMDGSGLKNVAASIAALFVAHYTSLTAYVGINLIDLVIVPCVSCFNYNPFHTKPIDALDSLKGKIKCPVVLVLPKKDGVLKSPDEDAVKLYNTLAQDNQHQTYVYVSNQGHNSLSDDLNWGKTLRPFFENKYSIFERTDQPLLGASYLTSFQLTSDQLREQLGIKG